MAEPRKIDGERDPPGGLRMRMVEQALKRFQNRPDALIEVLHVAQESFGHLSEEVMAHIARVLRLPESHVFGVATFYHFFTLRPPGEHTCIVCTGTVCHLQGAPEIVAALEGSFHLRAGETSGDGRLTLGTARCLGNCTLAPMLKLDDRVMGKETPESTVRQVRSAVVRGGGEREGKGK